MKEMRISGVSILDNSMKFLLVKSVPLGNVPISIKELNGPRRMEVVWDGLRKRGYKEPDVDKIIGGNLYRLYKDVIG
jgi:microsomal dipeptidase-like Zn-dependent dipeptidase